MEIQKPKPSAIPTPEALEQEPLARTPELEPESDEIHPLRRALALCKSAEELRGILAKMSTQERSDFSLDLDLAAGRFQPPKNESEPTLESGVEVREQVQSVLVVEKRDKVDEDEAGKTPPEPIEKTDLEVVKKLGGSAHKVIERVRDPANGKIFIRISAKEGKKDLFLREAEVYQALKGAPGILRVIAEDLSSDMPSMILEDKDLTPALDEKELQAMSLQERLKRATQMLAVMAELQKKGYLHVDLKEEHFMKDEEGNIFLIDFSMAKKTDEKNVEMQPSIPSGAMVQPRGKAYHRQAILRATPDEANGLGYDQRTEAYVLGNHLAYALAGRLIQAAAELDKVKADGSVPEKEWGNIKNLIHGMRDANPEARQADLINIASLWDKILQKKETTPEMSKKPALKITNENLPLLYIFSRRLNSVAELLLQRLYADPSSRARKLLGIIPFGKKKLDTSNPCWEAVGNLIDIMSEIIKNHRWEDFTDDQKAILNDLTDQLMKLKKEKALPPRTLSCLSRLEESMKRRGQNLGEPPARPAETPHTAANLSCGESAVIEVSALPVRIGYLKNFFRIEQSRDGKWLVTNETSEAPEHGGSAGLKATIEKEEEGKPMAFGRNRASVTKDSFLVRDNSFSRRHFEITFHADRAVVVSLSKGNSTFICTGQIVRNEESFQGVFLEGEESLNQFVNRLSRAIKMKREEKIFPNLAEQVAFVRGVITDFIRALHGDTNLLLFPEVSDLMKKSVGTSEDGHQLLLDYLMRAYQEGSMGFY